jgi:monoterpene epsilon-lactone hydrolase
MKRHSWFPCLVVLTQSLFAQQPADKIPPRSVSGYIDADGTAYITRKSLVAQHNLPPQENRGRQLRQMSSDTIRALYPANVEFSTIAGVPVSVVTPLSIPSNKTDRVLINLHGGGFTSDSGSLTESMPIANLTKIKVISVMYRLAPGYKFPAPVEDVVAVYRELLKTYRAQHIAIYGSSAGAVLTPEVAVKLKQLGLPLPGALGIFSGGGDFTRDGDSQQVYGVQGLSGDPDTRPAEGSAVAWRVCGFGRPQKPRAIPSFCRLARNAAHLIYDQYAGHAA